MAISESQKGRVIEQLVGATLILQSDGALRVSLALTLSSVTAATTSRRSSLNSRSEVLYIAVSFSLSGRGHYRADVRRATCAPNPHKFLLFVYYDKAGASLGDTCWLVRASEFCELLKKQKATRPVYVFDSSFTGKADMWVPFRYQLKEIASTILKDLK